MLSNPFENPEQRRRLIGYAFVGAIVAAPFLALLHALWLGALVMALALAATVFLAYDLLPQAPPDQRPRIRRLARINLLLAFVCLIAAIAAAF